MRTSVLGSFVLWFAVPAVAQSPVRVFDGREAGGRIGSVIAFVGDVDGDGHDDIAVGEPQAGAAGREWAGRVRVLGGRYGEEIFVVDGAVAGDRLGTAVAGAGDVDGDGFDDVIVGAPFDDRGGMDAGAAIVLAGGGAGAGSVLATMLGLSAFEQSGMAVAGVGDIDGDARPDVVVGAPLANVGSALLVGLARAYRGTGGVPLHTWLGAAEAENFGWAVTGAGDVDGDGRAEVAISSIERHRFGNGQVRVFSGATGQVVLGIVRPGSVGEFGYALAGGLDLDGNGGPDLVIGAPAFSRTQPTFEFQVGLFEVVDLVSGLSTLRVEGATGAFRVGQTVAQVDDVDGDSWPDVAAGSLRNRFEIWSLGSPGGLLVAQTGSGQFAATLRGDGDVDGDGVRELLIGSPLFGNQQAGRIEARSFAPPALTGAPTWISVASGGSQVFTLDAGAGMAGRSYVVIGSVSGISPGLPIGAVTLPLVFDGYSELTLVAANAPPFSNTFGTLDATGRANAALTVTPALFAGLQGSTFDHAFLVLPSASGGGFDFASNPVPMRLLP